MLDARRTVKVFGRGTTTFLNAPDHFLAYLRETEEEKVLVVNNLSAEKHVFKNPHTDNHLIVLHAEGFQMDTERQEMSFEPYGFGWFLVL